MTGRAHAVARMAVLGTILAVTGACGGSGGAGDASKPAAKETLTTVHQAAPDDRSEALVGSFVSTPWELTPASAGVNDGGVTLRINASAGGCFSYVRTVVDERDDSVLVASLAKDTRTGDEDACALNLTSDQATITLKAPLGDRALVHAPISPSWSDGS